MEHLSAPEVAALLAAASTPAPLLLDVREPWEYQTCHIEGSISLPMGNVPDQVEQLDRNAAIICICHHGMRSMRVAHFLESKGFLQVTNLTGGIHAWAQQVDAIMPTY